MTKVKILLVEDDPVYGELVREVFHENVGNELQWAKSLAEARNLIGAACPDVVISDLYLPDGQGVDLLSVAHAHSFPLIVMSGSDKNQDILQALRMGAVDYLLKSTTPVMEFPHVVERALREWKIRRDQMRMQVSLQESEARQARLLENLPDVVYRYRYQPKPHFEYISPAITQMTGYTPEEHYQDPWLGMKIVYPDDRQSLVDLVNRLHPHQTARVNLRWVHRNGEMIWTDHRITPFFKGDTLVAIEGIARDVTREEILQQQLLQSQKMEAIGSLAGGIAHDFNNLLYVIVGNAQLLLDDLGADHQSAEFIEEICRAGNRAADLVQQILTFSRQAQDQTDILDPKLIMDEALRLLRGSLPSTIQIKVSIDPDCGPVQANATQLHQVIVNLATNAKDAMRSSGGILQFELNEVDSPGDIPTPDLPARRYVHLSVSDNGEGIPPTLQQRVFEPYFTTKELGEGTGLGLAIVHGIVSKHGGFIKLDSTPGVGTRFDIYLPRAEAAASANVESPDQGEKLCGEGLILVVDDEDMILHVAETALRALGYQVECCNDSREALARIESQPTRFDLLITDQTMPHLTGQELAAKVLSINPEMPVVLCTGFSEDLDKDDLTRQGVQEILMKPINLRDLGTTVRRCLQGRVCET